MGLRRPVSNVDTLYIMLTFCVPLEKLRLYSYLVSLRASPLAQTCTPFHPLSWLCVPPVCLGFVDET